MNIVIKFSLSQFKNIQEKYAPQPQDGLPKGVSFRTKIPGVTITGYNSGKVMFQGQLSQQEAQRWSSKDIQTQGQSTKNAHDLPANFSHLSVLGSDEVGTGSYFGPLTTAAVFVDQSHLQELNQLGVEDSKKLSDPTIIKIAKHIMTICPYHVVNIKPHDYNRLIKQYNQAQLKAICHNFVLAKVLAKIAPQQPDAILIDQFVSPQTYFNYIQGQSPIVSQHVFFKEKGESYHLAVAAASIIARYVSLQTMDDLTAAAGKTLPIGAGSNVDQVAAELINDGQDLDQFAKLHFANTGKAQHLANHK